MRWLSQVTVLKVQETYGLRCKTKEFSTPDVPCLSEWKTRFLPYSQS